MKSFVTRQMNPIGMPIVDKRSFANPAERNQLRNRLKSSHQRRKTLEVNSLHKTVNLPRVKNKNISRSKSQHREVKSVVVGKTSVIQSRGISGAASGYKASEAASTISQHQHGVMESSQRTFRQQLSNKLASQ